MAELREELHRLYADASKHSRYQSVPDFVSEALGYQEAIDQGWRGDRPRLAYLAERHRPKAGERWGDFGANTGFFTLSLAHRHPDSHFVAIEANPNHARFIRQIVEQFGLGNVEVLEAEIGLRTLPRLPRMDFLLHLNVLHHAGSDFDADLVGSVEDFPEYAARYLTSLRGRARRMLFQLGSNWGGDRRRPLVGRREDVAKLRLFAGWLDAAGWRIESVAYPTRAPGGEVRYRDLAFSHERQETWLRYQDDDLEAEIDSCGLGTFPGEFYLRPIFICEGE